MKILVLCVDRDDDLGTKAGISGPIIGRQENIEAAQKLGLVDPEDVDTNSILSAISLYDDLVKKGMEAEIATITGDQRVGFQSDLIITRQLENTLELVKPDRAILVSDGQEDEYIYPMISSRIKIDSVKRVFVRQSESLEGFYYLLVKSLKDVKIRTKWILPLSLFLVILGVLYLIPEIIAFQEESGSNLELLPSIGFFVILIVLGVYLISWAYELDRKVRNIGRAMRQGSLAIPFALVSIMLIIIGLFLGFDSANAYSSSLLPSERSYGVQMVVFIQSAIWPIVFALLSYEVGKSLMWFLQNSKVKWSNIIAIISVFATGFMIHGVADAIDYFLGHATFETLFIYAEIVTGIMVAIFGAVLYASLRGETALRNGESGISPEAD